ERAEKTTTRNVDLMLEIARIDAATIALGNLAQQQTRVPCALLDGRFLSLSTTYEKLGRLVGREREGLDFADFCNMTLGVITNRIANVKPESRPRVYIAGGPDGLITPPGGSSGAETVELIARNVGAARKNGPERVSMEEVAVWDPDIIIALDRNFAARVQSD